MSDTAGLGTNRELGRCQTLVEIYKDNCKIHGP